MFTKLEFYNFFFHPLAKTHSIKKRIFSTITLLALGALTATVYFWLVAGVNLKDRQIKVIKKEESKKTQKTQKTVIIYIKKQHKTTPGIPSGT